MRYLCDAKNQASRRGASGEGETRLRLDELTRAFARIKGVPIEYAQSAVAGATEEQRMTWRSNAMFKSVIAAIRAEWAAKALDESDE